MEQKQLDDIDESFFGEEFVDDEPGIESFGLKPSRKQAADAEENITTTTKKVGNKKEKEKEKKVMVKKSKLTMAKSGKTAHLSKAEEQSVVEGEKEESVTIESAKVAAENQKAPVETSSPINPWAEESSESSSGIFKDISTWKAITGIVVILLLLSVFTQGFRFSESASAGSTLSPAAAKEQVLTFVNSNLLQPPFVATADDAVEENGLYRVTVHVGEDQVNSYITKDGALFFPQGFATVSTVDEQLSDASDASAEELQGSPAGTESNVETDSEVTPTDSVAETQGETSLVEDTTAPTDVAAVSEPAPETETTEVAPAEENPPETEAAAVAPAAPTPSIREFTLTAKRWHLTPYQVTVLSGDTVKLHITPEPGLAFTLTLPAFNVNQDVSGATDVEFVASRAGRYDLICSSCAQELTLGTVVVE